MNVRDDVPNKVSFVIFRFGAIFFWFQDVLFNLKRRQGQTWETTRTMGGWLNIMRMTFDVTGVRKKFQAIVEC